MLLSRKAKEIIFSVLMLAIPVVFLFANIKEPHRLNALDRFILALSSPIHQASVYIYRWVDETWRNYIYLVNLKSENDRLRAENGAFSALLPGVILSRQFGGGYSAAVMESRLRSYFWGRAACPILPVTDLPSRQLHL